MQNGWGTVTYTYNPYITDPLGTPVLGAGRLQTVSNSVLANSDITYTYDELGRVAGRSINGSDNSIGWTYDAMGRVTNVSNPLGAFTYNYVDPTYGTTRLSSVAYPNGQTVNYTWLNNAGDQRLQSITNLDGSSATLSSFIHAYDASGRMTQWTQQAGSAAPQRYDFGYDAADQVVAATLKDPSSGAILKQYYYGYDAAGNRLNEQIDSNINQFTYNNVNQISSNPSGGPVRFQGTISEPGTVSVNGSPATMATSTSFVANPTLSNGTNTVTVSATDGSNNTRTNTYQVTVTGAGATAPTYDSDGNTTTNNGQTYTWDARNQLIKIAYADSSTTEFTYDGLGRRVQIVEKDNTATVTSTKQFVWCGMEMCEERDASNTVTKRFYSQGEQMAGINYYYTRDHLGSVRELTNASGSVQSAYDYDPYGRQQTGLPAGAKLWLKADAGVTKDANNNVSAWADQSGNNNNCSQNTATAQPMWVANTLNGLPVVRFNGSPDILVGTTNFNPGSSDYTMFCVHERSTPAYGSAPFSFAVNLNPVDSGAPLMSWINTSNYFGTTNTFNGWGDAKWVDLSLEAASYHLSMISRKGGTQGNGGELTIRSMADGPLYQTKATQTWTSTTSGQYIVGCHNPDPNYPTHHLIGDVAEVIVYDRALTPAERTRVENYLAEKYNRHDMQSDFRYTGHYYHEKSGLTLAPYRAYDANLGRWLSRDPIEEEGGINLYGYVANNPLRWIDPFGLQFGPMPFPGSPTFNAQMQQQEKIAQDTKAFVEAGKNAAIITSAVPLVPLAVAAAVEGGPVVGAAVRPCATKAVLNVANKALANPVKVIAGAETVAAAVDPNPPTGNASLHEMIGSAIGNAAKAVWGWITGK
ncbi:MAG: hypothetical protein PHD76_14635 [Methylacidiphilales bacterium]|nr:hypothetical protein [Candidatus Methylacidiphilales bacterium]